MFRILLIVGVPTLKLCSEIRNPVQDTRLAVPSLEESVDRLVFTPIRQIQAEASSVPGFVLAPPLALDRMRKGW